MHQVEAAGLDAPRNPRQQVGGEEVVIRGVGGLWTTSETWMRSTTRRTCHPLIMTARDFGPQIYPSLAEVRGGGSRAVL